MSAMEGDQEQLWRTAKGRFVGVDLHDCAGVGYMVSKLGGECLLWFQ